MQEKLLKKVEELKKICLREAVSVFCAGGLFRWYLTALASVHHPVGSVLFRRSSQAKCQRSTRWASARNLLRSEGVWAPRSN